MSVSTIDAHTNTIARLESLYSELEKYNQFQANKVLELIEKVTRQEIMIGFAGHFSAGKSTMINHLVDHSILPSSPIPTSANIVKLSNGPEATIAYFSEHDPVKYEGSIDIKTIQAMCREGEKITGLDIQRPLTEIPSHVKILDTPGVDSTRDADRFITESSLHLMDYMFYVMDYNHVQSEVNLSFLLEMQQRQIPFAIIINQVDKHNEAELTFAQFQQSVKNSLDMWGIEPEHIFYTSLKEQTHSANQIEQVSETFRTVFKNASPNQMALHHASAIICESVSDYRSIYEEQMDTLYNQIGYDDQIIAEQEADETGSLLEAQKERIPKTREQFENRVLAFLSNAYLMPSELREYARLYLESMQPGFKVGFILTKKKTEEERDFRFENFHEQLKQTIEKNVTWPLRERMMQLLEENAIADSTIIHDTQSFDIEYPSSRLQQLIETGASVTGEYVLRYTDQLSKDIQRYGRSQLNQWWEQVERLLQQRNEAETKAHQQLFKAYEHKSQAEEELSELEGAIKEVEQQLRHTFTEQAPNKEIENQVDRALQNLQSRIKVQSSHELEYQEAKPSVVKPDDLEVQELRETAVTKKTHIHHKLVEAQDVLSNLDGFEYLVTQLRGKQRRLDHQQYTIALFGAFSAGKSSFANALLGEQVLPVSPNPTTATINKITASSKQHPHGTVTVRVKGEEQLLEDLAFAGKKVLKSYRSLEEAYQDIVSLEENKLQKLDHKKRSFLQAFLAGYEEMAPKISQEMTITLDRFAAFVSEEKKSCFIEWMELHYDCEWTLAGITLVDTPGADSVNARHTNVSFEYIKNADAILFVTYYNHPFSKADQSFLTQLGRVKDAFSMDKMFFIINAADLAEDEEEKHQVERYLQEQLLQFQIRKPRIYSLSSLQGLKEKQTHERLNSGLLPFEERFERFLQEELTEVLHHSIEHDLNEAVSSLQTIIEHARLSEQDREEKLTMLEDEQSRAQQVLQQKSEARGEKAITQKVDKQLHFVHQRMMLNFNDYFKNHFNPAVIKGDRSEAKEQIEESAGELLHEVEFEMNQEIKAVTLRIEVFIKELVEQYKKDYEEEIRRINRSLTLSSFEWNTIAPPDIDQKLSLHEKELADVLQLFKGTKSFFELNEKERMKEKFSERVSPSLHDAIYKVKHTIDQYYIEQCLLSLQAARDNWRKELDHSFNRLTYSLKHPVNVTYLQEQHDKLKEII
ncbi:dynamin family protein [Halobacillus hunanensis]|uniref:dynamin family protein n=1 Tax=Halobacillus hunanensis TaxID=578214 RepID=UPI0009A747FD|nr:dynamin family protein [Halobacillus hunanensis]